MQSPWKKTTCGGSNGRTQPQENFWIWPPLTTFVWILLRRTKLNFRQSCCFAARIKVTLHGCLIWSGAFLAFVRNPTLNLPQQSEQTYFCHIIIFFADITFLVFYFLSDRLFWVLFLFEANFAHCKNALQQYNRLRHQQVFVNLRLYFDLPCSRH